MSHQPIRPGFTEFIDFLDYAGVPLVVISGGLTGMVKAVLKKQQLIDRIAGIYAGQVDTTGEFLRVYSKMESELEFVAKVKAMAMYPAEEKIAIGDSVTDINMSLAADLVFARDPLKGYLDIENKDYIQWQDFFDIKDRLAARWQI